VARSLEHQGAGTEQAQTLVSLPGANTLAILGVDDRRENLVALEAVIAPLGFELVTATSGEEALRLLLERDFALILLDVRMPGLDGIETASLIKARERTREIPIVFLTAARDEITDMLRGYGVGAVDYVLKPLDEDLLRSKVAVFVELEQRRRALRHSEAFLRSAFEAAPIGKTLLDAQARIVRSNPAFARIVGRDQEALTGVPMSELCHPEDREALSTVLDRATPESEADAGVVDELQLDLRLLTEDRGEIWVAPTASFIGGTEYTTPLLLVQWVDVTARRRSEQTRAELLLEQAARAQAEASAERLEKLQRLLEALESPTLDDLLAEVARRLVDIFEAEAGEVQVNDGGDGQPILCASGAQLRNPGPDLDAEAAERWHEAPLTSDGVTIGFLRVGLQVGRHLTVLERALLRDAANHVSLLVRRMQLHEHEHRIATELQRGLRPLRLPELAGVELAAHSEVAGLSAEVGGDWYDAFMLPGERLGLVIGDVTGSGISAASAMGQLRSVTRAFALAEPEPPSPAQVLTRVHRYHQQAGFEQLFTVLYLILDRSGGIASWANAGHPPPLLRTRTGEVRVLEGSQSLMSLKDVVYEDQQATVQEGDTLILYTDGLIERRGEVIDVSVERLGEAVRSGPQDPESLCAYLLESASPPEPRGDDITTLVVRIVPRDARSGVGDSDRPGRVQMTVTPDVDAPRLARRMLERTFGAVLDGEELESAKLAVSELATNAVVHGRGEVTVFADLDDSRLLVEVIDEGSGFEHIVRQQEFDAIGGRGLNIVDAETSRWGMHEGTTHVWFEIERRGPRVGPEQRPGLGPSLA
jgi:PAS domain S-box-containing protein